MNTNQTVQRIKVFSYGTLGGSAGMAIGFGLGIVASIGSDGLTRSPLPGDGLLLGLLFGLAVGLGLSIKEIFFEKRPREVNKYTIARVGELTLPPYLLFMLGLLLMLLEIVIVVGFIFLLLYQGLTLSLVLLGLTILSLGMAYAALVTVYIRSRFSPERKWFFHRLNPVHREELFKQVYELESRLRSDPDMESSLETSLVTKNPFVGAEVILRLLDDPNYTIAMHRFLDRIKTNRGLRDAISDQLNYIDEAIDFTPHAQPLQPSMATGKMWSDLQIKFPTLVLKRYLIDIPVSSLMIMLFSPITLILCVLGIWVRGQRNAPAIISTIRFGLRGETFSYLRINATAIDPSNGRKNPTWLGRLLLWTGLDRLATLTNVLAGEMSIVGPHPLYMATMDRLAEDVRKNPPGMPEDEAKRYVAKRLAVKPGMTGLAQTRATIGPRVRGCIHYLALDVKYVENLSFWTDLLVLIQTFLLLVWGFITAPLILVYPGLSPFLVSPQVAVSRREEISRVINGKKPVPLDSKLFEDGLQHVTS